MNAFMKALAPLLLSLLLLLLSSCVTSQPPARSELTPNASRVLALVNEARARPRRCGGKRLESVPALARSAVLDGVAVAHARDMAARGGMSHAGADGSTPGERATRAGYRWRVVGENVARGQPTAERVVTGWMDSPHHCENIMDPDFTEMGIGVAMGAGGTAGPYWSQMFGRPAS
jgi:uncharacterized protein YkwD